MASRWIGSASSLSSIVTVAAPSPFDSSPDTRPTSTPAIRTGDPTPMLRASLNPACSSYGFENGLNFVKAK